MALIKHMIGEISGKIGGAVFGHNRGGSFVRKWKKPTNPNSYAQQGIRAVMANLVAAWNDTLDAAGRKAWAAYGKNVAMSNRLGDTIYLTGQQHFVRSNTVRVLNGLDRVDTGPTVFNLGELEMIGVVITAAATINVTFDDTAPWCDEDGAMLTIQQSPPMNATIDFFKAGFQRYGNIAGNAVTPPTTPTEKPTLHPFADGQKGFFRFRLTRADGRLSTAQILSSIASIA